MDIKVDNETVVVFDLDDTLYNELDYLRSAYRQIAKHLDLDEWMHLYSKMFSLYRSEINVFEQVAQDYDTEVDLLLDIYRNHQPQIQVFEGVREVFEKVKLKGGKIGILTDGRSATQRAKINSLGIDAFIDGIVISEEIGTEKPDIANFRTMESLISGRIYYYIADNLRKDFIAPNILGWKTVTIIDNGMNIHFDSHLHMKADTMPNHFILDFKSINVI